MKRGASSASSSGRSSGSRSTNARHHADDDTFQAGSAPSRESLPATTSATSAAASAGHGEGTNYLVALAGMRALESHVQDSSRGKRWKDRVTSWEERAGLGLPSVKLALGFLDVLGVSSREAYGLIEAWREGAGKESLHLSPLCGALDFRSDSNGSIRRGVPIYSYLLFLDPYARVKALWARDLQYMPTCRYPLCPGL